MLDHDSTHYTLVLTKSIQLKEIKQGTVGEPEQRRLTKSVIASHTALFVTGLSYLVFCASDFMTLSQNPPKVHT
jgi:hypothetical protein